MKRPATESIKLKNVKPTGYAPTTNAEARSVKIFWDLMSEEYIKGKPEMMDKNPNHDGIFEFTTADGTPIGNFAVQIKTLQKKNLNDPKYQCKAGFLAYCRETNIPVILIAVDQANNKLHWRHMDVTTIIDADSRLTRQSVSIKFPPNNVIVKGKSNYIAEWQQIVQQDVLLRRNAYENKRAYEKVEADFFQLREKLSPPVILNKTEIAAFQSYLDHINFILDVEFPALKEKAYSNYWKMGVAVTDIQLGDRSHFLIPIAYGSSELPVRQFFISNEKEMMEIFHTKQAIVLAAGTTDTILRLGRRQAYSVLQSNLLRAFHSGPLFVTNVEIANEYLAGFVTSFYAILGMDRKDDIVSLKELQYILTALWPVSYETRLSTIADWVTELTYSIDSECDKTPKPYYKERLNDAQELLNNGYLPRYKTDIYSKLFYLPLIHRYIDLLLHCGQKDLIPIYQTDQVQRTFVERHIGIKNIPLLITNLRIFFSRFLPIYEQFIAANFRHVAEQVDFFDGAKMLVFILLKDGKFAERPMIECYRIFDIRITERQIRFFVDSDYDMPIDRLKWGIDRDPSFTLEGNTFIITSATTMVTDFMFERSPTYAFIHKQILIRLENFFSAKTKSQQ